MFGDLPELSSALPGDNTHVYDVTGLQSHSLHGTAKNSGNCTPPDFLPSNIRHIGGSDKADVCREEHIVARSPQLNVYSSCRGRSCAPGTKLNLDITFSPVKLIYLSAPPRADVVVVAEFTGSAGGRLHKVIHVV